MKELTQTQLPNGHGQEGGLVTLRAAAKNLKWLDGRLVVATDDAPYRRFDDAIETAEAAVAAAKPYSSPERACCTPYASPPIVFRIKCAAVCVYLLIGDGDGKAIALHQMHETTVDHWDVALRLGSDRHRYRYYAENAVSKASSALEPPDDLPIQMSDFASFENGSI